MVKKLLLWLCLPLFLVSVVGCGDDDENTGQSLAVKNVYATGCKTDGQAQNREGGSMPFPGFEEYVEYTCKSDGYVFVRHVNALFNCCSEVIKVDVSQKGNDIVVTETETDNSCNCICPFDVSYEIGPLLPGKYNVKLEACGKTNSFTLDYPSGKGEVKIN